MNPTRGYPVRPDPFNIRVGYGFSLKKPEAGSGRVRVLGIPGPNPTCIYNIKKKKKKNPKYKFSLFSQIPQIHSHPLILSQLPSRLPFSPSPSLSLEQDRQCRCSASHAHIAGAAAPCIPRLASPRLAGAAPFSTSLVFPPWLLHLAAACRRRCSSLTSLGPPPPHKAATLSSPSPRCELKFL